MTAPYPGTPPLSRPAQPADSADRLRDPPPPPRPPAPSRPSAAGTELANHRGVRTPLLLLALLAGLHACDAPPAAPSTCDDVWDHAHDLYPDAGELDSCPDAVVARSLMVLGERTIDNDGATMTPCVEARCDADHVYIASNNLPHYDFVKTNPNALRAAPTLLRIPLTPATPAADVVADDPDVQDGCIEALDQYLDDPGQATAREPSGLCVAADDDPAHLRETLADGTTATTTKLACLGSTAVMINGVVTAGPNEAQNPDPYGNPLFSMPRTAGDSDGGGALDLCGGHSGGAMHYHGASEACFARAADGAPANSYATASQTWDLDAMLQAPCTAPSPILGWSPDGYPIKGPCVCTDADCATIKRARSSWVYTGLGVWGDPGDALAVDNQACATDDDCCAGDPCDYRCTPLVVDDPGPDGTAVELRCALLDYAWCTHRAVDRSAHPGGDAFVYLDRCNGLAGPDGYAYHAVASFPYIQACYRGEPQAIPRPGGDMGMQPPP
jgi:hypothetical protein